MVPRSIHATGHMGTLWFWSMAAMPLNTPQRQREPSHMLEPLSYQLLADAVLLLHFGVVVFVVAGLAAVVIGNLRAWRWVNSMRFRLVHLCAIGVVVVQSVLGKLCPLTVLESWLREQAGGAAYTGSFIEHWVQRILFHEAPFWVFTAAYIVFGLLVVAAWWRFPPRRKSPRGEASGA